MPVEVDVKAFCIWFEDRIEGEEKRIKEIRQQLEESEKNLNNMRQAIATLRKGLGE